MYLSDVYNSVYSSYGCKSSNESESSHVMANVGCVVCRGQSVCPFETVVLTALDHLNTLCYSIVADDYA